MLILTRKPGESLMIGEGIRVTILQVRGNQVRVGVVAPTTFTVDREEVFLRRLGAADPPDELDSN
jgi:carbon storage regulator